MIYSHKRAFEAQLEMCCIQVCGKFEICDASANEGIAVVTAEALREVSTSSPVLESNSRIGILHLLPDIPEENITFYTNRIP